MTSQPGGFLAPPPWSGSLPVLLLHPWWGLNDTLRAFATRLAEHDFTVFCPDLFGGRTAVTIQDAEALSQGVEVAQVRTRIAEATSWLLARTGRPSLSIIGFSYGAYFALERSIEDAARVHAVVVYYGTGPSDFTKTRASYMGHFAEKDDFEPSTAVDALQQSLRTARRCTEIFRYPGTGHWFAESDRADAFNPEAAELAFIRTLSFLRSDALHDGPNGNTPQEPDRLAFAALSPESRAEQESIVAEVDRAFEEVTREGGIGWHESWEVDGYGTLEERAWARSRDSETHWRELVDRIEWVPFRGVGGFSFLDPIAFRYYLAPTLLRFLRGEVTHWYPGHLLSVFDSHAPDPSSAWTASQRRAIARFISFMARHDSFDDDGAWNSALDKTWRPFLAE